MPSDIGPWHLVAVLSETATHHADDPCFSLREAVSVEKVGSIRGNSTTTKRYVPFSVWTSHSWALVQSIVWVAVAVGDWCLKCLRKSWTDSQT